MVKESEKDKQTKENLAKEVNDILGLNIDFQRIKIDDLKALHNVLTTPGKLVQVMAKAAMKWPENIREALGIGTKKSGGGILGFGIFPGLTEIRGGIRSRVGLSEQEDQSKAEEEAA